MSWDWPAFFRFLGLVVGFAIHLASLIVGFALGPVAVHYNHWRRTRNRHRQIATALVYDMRRVIDGLKELVQGMESTRNIICTSDVTESFFTQSQDLAEFGGPAHINTSAFYP